ncbi:MAG: ferritin-like domain-containing protein [Dehalococcoidia bacterium]
MAIDVREVADAESRPELSPGLDLSWLNLEENWGTRAQPGKKGMTLEAIATGPYGKIPDSSRNDMLRLRGTRPRAGALRVMPYTSPNRADVWADNAMMLYEEAVQRQWSSATDIPWTSIEPLSDDVERAMCQLCTFLAEVEFIAGDTPGKWIPRISPDYFEVSMFLGTQIMDESRHEDVFRKRALVNGGGLLQQGPGYGLRKILEANDFTEMSALMHVQGEGFVQSMFRMGELLGQNDAEKRIFRLCAQDESRHLAFGVMHLKYTLEKEPWRREEIHAYLDKSERDLAEGSDISFIPVFEAMSVLLGGGREHFDAGAQKFLAIRKKQVNEYMHRLEVCGLPERRERMAPELQMYLDPK